MASKQKLGEGFGNVENDLYPAIEIPALETGIDVHPANGTIDAEENLGGNIGFRASVDRNAFNMLNALCEETGLTRNECVELALYTLFSAQKAQVETRFRAMMDARTNAVLSKWE